MTDAWEFYLTELGDAPASIVLDLGLMDSAPDGDRPWLLWIRIPMLKPRPEDGLSSTEEAPQLHAIEEELSDALATFCGAINVGHLTHQGIRDVLLYGRHNHGIEEVVDTVAAKHLQRGIRVHSVHDPGWRHYLDVLCPSEDDMAWIEDRRIMDGLIDAGDLLDVPRVVQHRIEFPDGDACARCSAEAQMLGFSGLHGENALTLTRMDRVELEHIHAVATALRQLAREHGGSYAGWTCTPQRH